MFGDCTRQATFATQQWQIRAGPAEVEVVSTRPNQNRNALVPQSLRIPSLAKRRDRSALPNKASLRTVDGTCLTPAWQPNFDPLVGRLAVSEPGCLWRTGQRYGDCTGRRACRSRRSPGCWGYRRTR